MPKVLVSFYQVVLDFINDNNHSNLATFFNSFCTAPFGNACV